jgi:preprotein translocase subunit SecF
MFNDIGDRLYSGEKSFDFIGKWRVWYSISAVAVLIAIAALIIRGLTLGIEFKGGAEFVIPATETSISEARQIMRDIGLPTAVVVEVGQERFQIQTPALTSDESLRVASELANDFGVPEDEIAVQSVGPSWGADITRQALISLGVFLFLVVIFLSIYLDWRMAVAALVALFHDVIITVGVYAIFGLKVTPATVIGVITILSYSLYDTVVVFDKVRENTRGILQQSRYTYNEAVNLAINQSLIRSINTSISTLFPITAILVVGAGIFSAGTLIDLALALVVGVIAGTYSSIFIAPCVLAQLKDRQPAIISLDRRIAARRAAKAESKSGKESGANSGVAEAVVVAQTGSTAVVSASTKRRQPRSKGKRKKRK